MVHNSYFVLALVGTSVDYVTVDDTVSTLDWAKKYKTREEAKKDLSRVKHKLIGELKVAEIITIVNFGED